MKHLSLITILAIGSLAASAALQIHWDVELTAQPPQVFTLQRPRGETYELEAVLKNHGKTFEQAITNAFIYWQTNGMENLYWSAPASASNNVLRATWLPSMDPGATTVRGYIGDPGHIYAAAFQFRFISSPGELPNIIEQPPRVLDLTHTVVINAPWPTDETIDARIRQVIEEDHIVAPVETNVVTGIISNTVTRQFVEDLGISGGGGGGVDTNAVRDIAKEEVASSTNSLRRVDDMAVYEKSYTGRESWFRNDREFKYIGPTNLYFTEGCICWGDGRGEFLLDNGHIIAYYIDEVGYIQGESSTQLDEHPDHLDFGPIGVFTRTPEGSLVPTDDSLSTTVGVAKALTEFSKAGETNELVRGKRLDSGSWDIRVSSAVNANEAQSAYTAFFADCDRIGNEIITTYATKTEVNEAKTEANEANVWSSATFNFMTGGRTNCWFSGTNYVFGTDAAARTRFAWEDGMDAATVPCSMALWEIRDGERQLVWDQRDWTAWYWSFKANQMQANVTAQIEALGLAVTNDSNYAWAKRYASDGTPNPDASTTFIDTPSVTLSPGMKWETVATVSGAAYWTIVGDGAIIGGGGTNAVLRIQDFEGNDIMTVTKGEHRLAWIERGEITAQMYDGDGWVCFDMLADAEPIGYFSTTLDASDFVQQTDPDCPAQYAWEDLHNGKYRIHYLLKPGIQSNACFAKFQVEVEGQTIIRYNAGQEISGGLIYNGVKIAPDISGSPAAGTVIQWKVVH